MLGYCWSTIGEYPVTALEVGVKLESIKLRAVRRDDVDGVLGLMATSNGWSVMTPSPL